jgi:hypothetical protein
MLGIPGLGPQVDEATRAVSLRHELAHGAFFTRPDLAARVMQVWQHGLTEAERAGLRRYLQRAGYDPRQEDLMANEAMAYLLHTPDTRFFNAARDLGWTPPQLERIRGLFAEAMR